MTTYLAKIGIRGSWAEAEMKSGRKFSAKDARLTPAKHKQKFKAADGKPRYTENQTNTLVYPMHDGNSQNA